MKSPPVQHRDEDARHMVEAFIADSPATAKAPSNQREAALVAD